MTDACVICKRREMETMLADWQASSEAYRLDAARLRALCREAIPFINDAGNDEDPEAQTRANDLFVRIAAALKDTKP